MALAAIPLATARSMLNDSAGSLWTDAALLPYMKEASRELAVRLALNGVPVVNAVTAILSVTAGVTDLSTVSGYPTDLTKPEWMKERAVGAQDRDFVDMHEVAFIPQQNQDIILCYWCWIGEKVQLLGSTQTRQVQLRYWKAISTIVDATSQIGFIFGENYLGPRTAAMAANSVGNTTLYESASNEALLKIDEVVRMNVKGTQNLPARRRAYHRGPNTRIIRNF